ncbi:MAG: hypothetical protein C0176_00335 [Mesoaciditoga sp.]|uniref:lytic transglycosylase domain-containing protein n=1 Tax=Athalassotoga sp. TaxID=2022597 RepID=UPI000CBF8106|nr:MAG: hypothetical protein C0185_01475 [Mesoaciditoga sp.]PMP80800.1 MAG: hypothetical protein C0176_00335 [Mesoaciditoga sp.]HEU23888.1 lytic transglycosylase domain-containing protein [Mesoaciditoga lauensis]
MKRAIVFMVLSICIALFVFGSPIIGGFSVDTPFLPLSVQPYSLYYYPGIRYEGGYGTGNGIEGGFGFTIPIPWMNFSQLPISKSDLPIAISIAKAESAFQNYSLSSSGAQGLMQFMPSTAPAFGVQNPYDPFQSVTGALNYIKLYQKQFNSLQLAIAAYNAGPGAVSYYGGIPPYPETQAYVSEVMNYLAQYTSTPSYPNIYARLGAFVEYKNSLSGNLGNLTMGLSYPLPPGQIDICPEVSLNSTSVNLSWIWRITLGNNVYIAFNHSDTIFSFTPSATSDHFDEVEISGTFGPATIVVGDYKSGLAGSLILNLWNQRLFGSISQSSQINYGISFHLFKIYLNLWAQNLSSSTSYNVSLTGRW